ncbi:hypothetical protein D3C75_1074670 [compost metagenome]
MLYFRLMEHVTVGHAAHPFQVEHIFLFLNVGSQTLHPVSDFDSHRTGLNPADLLEIRKLCNFHAIQPYFPAETRAAQRRVLPVVLNETDVMQKRIYAKRLQTIQIQLLNVVRRRLDNYLELVMLIQTVRVFPVTAV